MKKLLTIFTVLLFMSAPAWGYDTLVDAQTAAATTDFFSRSYEGDITIVAHGLAGTEEIEIEVEYADGSYTDVYNSDGDQIVLTATSNVIVIQAFGRFRVVKPTTAAAVTVVKYSQQTP